MENDIQTPKDELNADDLNLITLAQEYQDEDKARALFELWRWPNGKPICPHCQHDEAYKLTSKPETKKKIRKGVYCCAACRKTFTATVGTVMEDSHVPISKWMMAIFLISSSKKGMSSHQLHRMLGVTYKTAWFMAHRIRYAMGDNSNEGNKLKGVVEVDETFIGGKGDIKTKFSRKTPVVALIERGGNPINISTDPTTGKEALSIHDLKEIYKELGNEFDGQNIDYVGISTIRDAAHKTAATVLQLREII